MALTANELANDMLAHIGLDMDNASLTTGMTRYIIRAMQQGLELMREKCPEVFRQRMSVTFTNAAAGTITISDDLMSFSLV